MIGPYVNPFRRQPAEYGGPVLWAARAACIFGAGLLLLILTGVGTLTGGKQAYTVEIGASANGDTDWQYMEGLYSCTLFGTPDSASIDLETRVQGTGDVVNVGVAAFVGMTAAVDWTSIEAGSGEYRLEVASGGASMDLTWTCRRVRR